MFFKTNGGNMSILKPITEKKAKGKVKKIYNDIKSCLLYTSDAADE